MAVDVGTGTTVVLGTTAYAAEITGVSGDGTEVPVLDTTHMTTTGSRDKMTGDLIDEGSVSVDIHFDPNLENTIPFGTTQTCTITFPIPSGGSAGATASGGAALTSRDWDAPLEDKMTGSYTITWLGAVTWADST